MFASMANVRRGTIKELIQLVYFMRGSIQYDAMKELTYVERQEVSEFIEKRLKDEAKKMYPVY